ncbi:MAG TPA: serine--tRNA ligase [Candidatus Baltobacteraceae bacterium]|nr:serine--tRNA ligase [Candidatus Baltobacteraceae bacterium]
MLDIVVVRRDPDRVRRSARRRGLDPSFVDDVLRYDMEYRSALSAVEQAQAEKNRLSAEIGKAADKAAAARELRPRIDELSRTIAGGEERAKSLAPDAAGSPLRDLLENSPNLLDDSVPDGAGEADNVVARTWGTPRAFDFSPKPHWEVGEELDILDFERAAKLSGSRFALLRGAGARLSRALVDFFLDRASDAGYLEVNPPLLVNRSTMWSTGQLSKFADAMFADVDADLFMIPTAEVPLTAMHGDEILSVDDLPRRYTAYTPCFRKEAGAAGKDTRGLIRLHQFEKVELVWLAAPEASFDALERLTADAEALLQALELPYRVMTLCSADVGFNATKTYDIEVWLPSAGAYREISSCSNCIDFQARRGAIRFRREPKSKPELVHTLNGSGLAIGRALVAILENYQQADGSVLVPNVLRPYTKFDRISPR